MYKLFQNYVETNGKKKDDIYESVKQYSFLVKGGMSNLSKNDLNNFRRIALLYKNKDPSLNNFVLSNNIITLDSDQERIVKSNYNITTRIIAGAGSGKTTTILCKIKHMVDNYVLPCSILVLTFNVDAAENMKKKIIELFGFDININIRNIDSFCSQIVYAHDMANTKNKILSLSEICYEGLNIMKKYGKCIANDYKYVFFDEFQDVSDSQFEMLKIMSDHGSILTVIGDDCQNIYQWRGTNNYYMINLEKLIGKKVNTFILTKNYRSIMPIVELANNSIKNNIDKIDKTMVSCKKYDSNLNYKPNLVIVKKSFMMDYIISIVAECDNYGDIAILANTGTYLKEIETRMAEVKIPHVALITDKSNIDIKKQVMQDNKVTITTIHKSKGLEWKKVIIVGLCDNYFPSHMNNNMKNIEEDRRLFYVGVTRAIDKLYFVCCKNDIPLSRFVDEVFDYIDIDDKALGGTMAKDNYHSMLFKTEDCNKTVPKTSVTEIIHLFKSDDFKRMKEKNLLPKTFDDERMKISTNLLYDEKLFISDKVKNYNLEGDYGTFIDRLVTRELMMRTEDVYDNGALYIIDGLNITNKEAEICNKCELSRVSVECGNNYDCMKKEVQKSLTQAECMAIDRILLSISKGKDFRRISTYPDVFMNKLRTSYLNYVDKKYKTDDIMKDIYYVSLCDKFMENRKRLVYMDVCDIFMDNERDNFDKIKKRIYDYSDRVGKNDIILKGNVHKKIMLKVRNGDVTKMITPVICGEIDMIDFSEKILIDFKASESSIKLEWVVQVMFYYSMLKKEISDKILYVGIFNVITGEMFKMEVPKKYDSEMFINEIVGIIGRDVNLENNNKVCNIDDCGFFINDNNKDDYIAINNKIGNTIDDVYVGEENNKNNKNNKNYYMVFDVENNQNNGCDDILQISYIIYDNEFNKIKEVNKYIKNRVVDKRTYDVHKLTSEFLDENGEDFEKVMDVFVVDIVDVGYIVGHNVETDMRKVRINMIKHMKYFGDIFEGKKVYDTMKMGKDVYGESMALEVLYGNCVGKKMENMHNAYYDALFTWEVFVKLYECVS